MRPTSLAAAVVAGAFGLVAPAAAQSGAGYGAQRYGIHQLVVRTFGGIRDTAGETFSVTPRDNFAPDEATLVVQRVVSATGLRPNFYLIPRADYDNASAGIAQDTIRVIVYDPKFIDTLNDGGSNWGATSIFAHEIGHHLQGHTLQRGGSRPPTELEADEFSGWVMARLGATLAQAQAVMARLAPEEDGRTHPGRARRLAAIERGWQQGRGGGTVAGNPTGGGARPAEPPALEGPFEAVRRFIGGMRGHDAGAVRGVLAPDARMLLIAHNGGGDRDTTQISFDQVVAQAAGGDAFDERTIDRSGEVNGDVATVLHYYNYYINGARTHCGGERYTLRRAGAGVTKDGAAFSPAGAAAAGGWRIVAFEDHQVKDSCPERP